MYLHALARGIAELPPDCPDMPVLGLAADSRRASPGEVFVAVRGTKSDGGAFAADAVARGAVVVVSERPLPGLGVPVLTVPHAGRALGLLADRLQGEPSRQVRVMGVTGTNGKTTTAFLVRALLEAAGRPTALLGTVTNRVGGVARPATQTTPDPLSLHAALACALRAGERDLAMEVSSHALDQERVAGVRFAVAAFTNLTRDHLDYHKTLEAYGAAKARLFEGLEPQASAVLNARDPFSAELARRTPGRVVCYGAGPARTPPRAEVWAEVLGSGLAGTALRLHVSGAPAQAVSLPLLGEFNLENALCAAGSAWAMGLTPEEVARGLEVVSAPPGRLERVPGEVPVLVDYAHTPDALEKVLGALRPLVRGRLLVVFGCGGDRDPGKRAPMGRAVERWADLSFLTSDNPRSEDPRAIMDQVLAGFERPLAVRRHDDRAEAIAAAIQAAGPGDVVVLAGKGHEQGQVLRDRTVPFDDRDVARHALFRRGLLRAAA